MTFLLSVHSGTDTEPLLKGGRKLGRICIAYRKGNGRNGEIRFPELALRLLKP